MTAEPYREPDYTTWRAVLIEYEHVGVYSCRSIHVEATPLRLLREVAPVVLGFAETLVSLFWEHFAVNNEVLQSLFDPNDECPLLRDCHDRDEIVPLLRHMAKMHENGLADAASDESILGEWYQELLSISDVAADPDYENIFIRVPLEGDVPTFVRRLLEHEARRFDARLVLVQTEEERIEAVGQNWRASKLNDGDAIDLGQLAVLAHVPDWQWRNQATMRAFWKWVRQFNEGNEG